MSRTRNGSETEFQLGELREWVKANTMRIEELEATAFQLLDEEEVLVIALPRKHSKEKTIPELGGGSVAQRRIGLAVALIAVGAVGLSLMTLYSSGSYSLDRASNIAERYLRSLSNPDLAIGEIMEFEQNFYIIYYEKSTGIGAFEMLIDKATGPIFPEYGPNMMWNTKYGHGGMMGGGPGGMMGGWSQPATGEMPIDEDEAVEIAQEFLDSFYPGTVADDPHPFYGYYTLHAIKDREIYGMLSVNGYDGEVWYHNWHGAYVRSLESH